MDSKTQVVHCCTEEFDVYIGRATSLFPEGSIWENPFKIGRDGTRAEVMEKMRQHLKERPDLMARLEELRGKRLGCYCRKSHQKFPPCHGDIYVELLEGAAAKGPEQISLFD